MFVNKTSALDTRIDRYENCRNCNRRFVTRQPQKYFVREVKPPNEDIQDNFSRDGKTGLTIHKEAG